MPLFEVCIVQNPTKRQREEGELEKIIMAPKLVVAADSAGAGFQAIMDQKLPDDADKTRLEVLVRPFG